MRRLQAFIYFVYINIKFNRPFCLLYSECQDQQLIILTDAWDHKIFNSTSKLIFSS